MPDASQERGSARVPSAAPQAAEGSADLLDQLRRERADFLNYKRRLERDRAEDRVRERADVVTRLLPLLDDLDRALDQLPPELAAHPWARGVLLGRSGLAAALRDLGVERIGTEGEPFDPAWHEAQFFEQRPHVAAPTVGAVIRPGYRIGQRLLRAAQVGVVSPPEHSPSPTPPADQES
jgi:molecular chaperone GrpE